MSSEFIIDEKANIKFKKKTLKEKLENIESLEIEKDSDGFYLDASGEKISFNGIRGLKPAYSKLKLTEKHIEEIYKCSVSILYFFHNYCQILTQNGFTFPEPRPYQDRLLSFLSENPRALVMMPRQSAKSVTIGIYILHKILFNRDAYWGIAANQQKMAIEVLNKIKQTFSRLPIWLQQGVLVWNNSSITLENGSKILTSATSENSFRGFTFASPGSGIFIDECAFIRRNTFENFSDAVLPTVSSSKNSQVIFASTPNGLNHWYNLWKDSENSSSEFKRFEIKWNEVPGRDEEWLNKQIETYGKTFCEQNYLCNFIGSSETLISPSILSQLRSEEPEIIDNFYRGFKIYFKPKENHKYIIGVDTSKGIGDYSCINVLDVTKFPFIQAAVGKLKVEYIKLPEIIESIGKYYNYGYIIIENVEGSGQSVADVLWNHLDYENLYFDENKKYPGFRTTAKTRKSILNILKTLLENKKLIIKDKETIDQFYRFVLINGKYQAEEGYHDDIILSLAICLAPFINVKKFDDYKKFVDALLSENSEEETFNFLEFGCFQDGTEDEKINDPFTPTFEGFDDIEYRSNFF